MTRLPFVLLLTAIIPALITAESADNKWKKTNEIIDSLFDDFLSAGPHHSLADAHLAPKERAMIYQSIDDEELKAGFRGKPKAERGAVLDSEVGDIVLAQEGSTQVAVIGPKILCGKGGCAIRIFIRQSGGLHLAFYGGAKSLIAKDTVTKGFHDIETLWVWGAYSHRYSTYRWTGSQYKRTQCYDTKYEGDPKKYSITSCEPEPNR